MTVWKTSEEKTSLKFLYCRKCGAEQFSVEKTPPSSQENSLAPSQQEQTNIDQKQISPHRTKRPFPKKVEIKGITKKTFDEGIFNGYTCYRRRKERLKDLQAEVSGWGYGCEGCDSGCGCE